MEKEIFKLQMAVFALVTASFTNIYMTQPILPVLQDEFGVTPVQVSLTVSAVILGIVLSNLFFGFLSDRFPIHPIILTGGLCVAAGGIVSALTHDFKTLIAARLFQGIFIPALTTSLAAWLARTLPGERLSVVMGSYISATVLGGLGGRLIGGWIHPPLHWRYAFVSASVFVVVTTIFAVIALPRTQVKKTVSQEMDTGFISLLKRKDLLLIYCCGAGGLLIFSPVFNFLPYRLADAPFHFSTEQITLIYFVYVMGIFIGPLAGRINNRFGGGNTLIAGTCVLGFSLVLLLFPSIIAVIFGLLGICAGFFTIHAVAVGLLNRKLSGSHGKANALYVMFYYAGGWLGITGAGFAFQQAGWKGVVGFVMCFLVIPFFTGVLEKKSDSASAVD
ncbi:MFS transporter [Desulfococcaceae bacterium HSG7]|nr:MFS transporter [Desulfococcaceae bacterium HSG7]